MPLGRSACSHFDDEDIERYNEDEKSVSRADQLRRFIRLGTISDDITPVLLARADNENKDVQPLLDLVVDYLPSPLDTGRSRASAPSPA